LFVIFCWFCLLVSFFCLSFSAKRKYLNNNFFIRIVGRKKI
jgi:hypothetical protein